MIDVVTRFDKKSGKTRSREAGFDAEARKTVRVEPRDEHVRRVLRHGVTKVRFLAEGAAEWPNDTFTKRRIADGDVRVVAAEQPLQRQQDAGNDKKKLPAPENKPA